MPAPKKNALTKLGGKAAKAIQKKAAKEFGVSLGLTKGQLKSTRKISKFNSSMFDPEDAMPPYEYNKGRLIDFAAGKSKKVKVKNLNKVVKKESTKNVERLYKNKILKKTKSSVPVKKNTTVKKRSK